MKPPVLALWLFLLLPTLAFAASLYSRNLSCGDWNDARARHICRVLEREMEWTWTGHAIVAPGFRVTFETVRRAYCAAGVAARDTPALVAMVIALERKADNGMARAQALNGARFLLYLLGAEALRAFPDGGKDWDDRDRVIAKNLREEVKSNISDSGTVWHPANPQYLLRAGCR